MDLPPSPLPSTTKSDSSYDTFSPLVPRQPGIDKLLGLLSNPGFRDLDLDGVRP